MNETSLKCKNCHHQPISAKATVCPKCGEPDPVGGEVVRPYLAVEILTTLVGLFFFAASMVSTALWKKSADSLYQEITLISLFFGCAICPVGVFLIAATKKSD